MGRHRPPPATLPGVGSTRSLLGLRNLRRAQPTQPVDGFGGASCPVPGAELTHLSSDQDSEAANSGVQTLPAHTHLSL